MLDRCVRFLHPYALMVRLVTPNDGIGSAWPGTLKKKKLTLSLCLTGPFACIISITFFNQYHYPKSECYYLYSGQRVIYTKVSLGMVTPRVSY